MRWDTFEQDNYNTLGGYGGSRVGKVRAGTTSTISNHKGLSYSKCQRSIHSISEWNFRNLALYNLYCISTIWYLFHKQFLDITQL